MPARLHSACTVPRRVWAVEPPWRSAVLRRAIDCLVGLVVNRVDPGGSTTSASAYDHNVLALGFLSSLDITFDDTNYVVYMTAATTAAPTILPTRAPTTAPTKKPTWTPTAAPTKAPTRAPTKKTTTKADEDVAMSVTMSPVAPVTVLPGTSGGPAVRTGDHGLWLLFFVGIVATALGR